MSASPSWTKEQLRLLSVLWPTELTLREMSLLIGKGKSCISETAHRKGYAPRTQIKSCIAKNIAPSIKRPSLVTRRCEVCRGQWVTTAGGYEHPNCPAQRKAA